MASARNAMSIQEVVDMSRSGVSDGVIVNQIRSSGTAFRLTPADVTNLHQQGVTDPVINAMLESGRRPVVVAGFHLGASASDLRAALESAMQDIFREPGAMQ